MKSIFPVIIPTEFSAQVPLRSREVQGADPPGVFDGGTAGVRCFGFAPGRVETVVATLVAVFLEFKLNWLAMLA